MIKAIITDVGGVLAKFDALRFYQELARTFHTMPGDIANLRMNGESSPSLIKEFCRGRLKLAQVRDIFERKFGISIATEEFVVIWRSGFVGFYSAVWKAIHDARRKYNLRVVSCTNVDPVYGSLFRGDGELFTRFFNAEVQSWKVGALKPEQRMYEDAVRAAQVPPDQCLFIDDVGENVIAARRFGLQAIEFTGDILRLREDLYKYGLNTD